MGGSVDDQAVVRLLREIRSGNRAVIDELLPLLYDELRHAAHVQRRRQRVDDTLNTTALVHEAYLRLAKQPSPPWQDRAHFLAVASIAMRRILLDYAKRKHALKRGGTAETVPLHEIERSLAGEADPAQARAEALVALNESLRRLEAVDARQGRIVECRFFGCMSVEDTAEALGISSATVKRGWAMAQAWLYRDLKNARET